MAARKKASGVKAKSKENAASGAHSSAASEATQEENEAGAPGVDVGSAGGSAAEDPGGDSQPATGQAASAAASAGSTSARSKPEPEKLDPELVLNVASAALVGLVSRTGSQRVANPSKEAIAIGKEFAKEFMADPEIGL